MNEISEWVQRSSWPSKSVTNIMVWCILKCLWQTKPLKGKQNWSHQQSLWTINITRNLHLFSSFPPRKIEVRPSHANSVHAAVILLLWHFIINSILLQITFPLYNSYKESKVFVTKFNCITMSSCGQKQRVMISEIWFANTTIATTVERQYIINNIKNDKSILIFVFF